MARSSLQVNNNQQTYNLHLNSLLMLFSYCVSSTGGNFAKPSNSSVKPGICLSSYLVFNDSQEYLAKKHPSSHVLYSCAVNNNSLKVRIKAP